ncbi:T9SS type A sorting domain-containing protein [uncultured Algibacter sp.]|uniref:T9SS type A sorting domain-containing protein n=1 Tax=uncultured Algibacter sp. TaxID=298659 RepID=UPI0026221B12|nr:T9SS type A sorting domain-containing protein [uncultured Algibacter sp.]
MKNIYLFFIAFCLSLTSLGQVIFNHNFNFGDTSGDLVTISSNFWFEGNTNSPKVGYQEGSLSLTNYEYLVKGGSATINNGVIGESVATGFGSVNSGDVFYSALVNLSSTGTGDSGFFMHLNTTGSEIRGRLFAKTDGGGFKFGIISQGSNANIKYGTNIYSFNTTYLVVVKYDFSNGVSTLYVLSAPTALESGATVEAISDAVTVVAAIDEIGIRQHTNGPVGAIDNIRVATTWADIMQTYFDSAIDGSDMPKNCSLLTIDPGTAASASVFFNTANFTASNDTGSCTSEGNQDGYIAWEIEDTSDNSIINSGCIFNSDLNTDVPIPGMLDGKTYKFTATLVDNSDVALTNLEAEYSLTITVIPYIDVTNIGDLRGQTISETLFYSVTGQVVLSYGNDSDGLYFFQDNSGGITVTDENGFMPVLTVGDVFDTLRGNLKTGSNGELILEITQEDRADPTVNNGDVATQEVTLLDLNNSYSDYESELVLIKDVDFIGASGDFALNASYAINDGSRGFNVDTFSADFGNADYIQSAYAVPTVPQDLVVLVRSNTGSAVTVTARSTSDMSNTLSVDDFNKQSFKLYPNPTSLGYINIASKNQSSLKISVLDVLGKQISSESIKSSKLDVSHLKSGLYLLKIEQEGNVITKKLVIQ